MATLTVIVTAFNNAEKLKYTFEGLVEQSSEEFDVVIVDTGCDMEAKAVIREYCDEYVGFEAFEIPHCLVPEARNEGVKKAKGELVYFVDGGDYISPDTIESILKAADETKADIFSPRFYVSGENEPYYDGWMDMLATVPDIDRFDRALLNTLDFDGRVYKKKFFDLYSLSFPAVPVFYNAAFMVKCIFGCDAKMTGVAGAIYARRRGIFSDGFPEMGEPSEKNLDVLISVYEEAYANIRSIIEEETGAVDGDEYTVQEILTVYFEMLTNCFYRYFWYLSDASLEKLRSKFEGISALLTEERRNKLNKTFSDLRFPQMYITRQDAANIPLFSILADLSDNTQLDEFINSLYVQKFPFFELFVKKSAAEDPSFPERWRNVENIIVLPDEGFFAKARAEASGITINVKDPTPLDPRILSELSLTKAPRSFIQYMFTSKRKQYSAKTYLKKKGLAMQ
ncbi:MAG: glycosyltransferase family 2 protein [Clostridia bacterium]|nr:glycosyltransferase family 2 protein [Clostridia bacterium]